MIIVKFILLLLQVFISVVIGVRVVNELGFTNFQGYVIIILLTIVFLLFNIFVNNMKE